MMTGSRQNNRDIQYLELKNDVLSSVSNSNQPSGLNDSVTEKSKEIEK